MRFSRTSEMRRRRRRRKVKVKVKVKKKARGGERIGEKEKESKRATVKKGVSFGHRISLFFPSCGLPSSHTHRQIFQ